MRNIRMKMALQLLGLVYDSYEATEFSKNMIGDVNAIIKGYYEDLTTIFNFRSIFASIGS